jgi:hypothetical protein
MTPEQYHAAPALSASGMKHLTVSPLRYWWLHLSPDRPVIEETPAMRIGTALHYAVLEPSEFERLYVSDFTAPEGTLVVAEDLKGYLNGRGIKPAGTTKAGWIAQVQAHNPEMPIYEVIRQRFAEENKGKTILKAEEWQRVMGMTEALRNEPRIKDILSEGKAEVPLFTCDPETKVALKAKLDWVNGTTILDLKTFTQMRGKSIDQCVADALFYEKYIRQAVFYCMLSGWPEWRGEFVFAFCESEEPFEIRIVAIRPKTGGQPNLYWQQAVLEIRSLIRLYADCVNRFGDRPWRFEQAVHPLQDEDIRQLAYS